MQGFRRNSSFSGDLGFAGRRSIAAVFVALVVCLSGCSILFPPPPAAQSPDAPTASAPTSAPTSAPVETAEGVHFKLAGGAAVYVPASFNSPAAPDVVVHFHGVATVTEREFAAAAVRAVLITVNYNGLSAAYEKPLADAKLFGDLLDETLTELKARGVLPLSAKWRRVGVSSFSAGFGAVRALLRQPRYYRMIDALYLADTVYAGYVDVDGERRVNPENMKDFRRFAQDAANGQKWMFITHSYLAPGEYAGTHETADDLVAFVGAERRQVDYTFSGGAGVGPLHVISRADLGKFFVRGCEGTAGQDHMGHLRNMRIGYSAMPIGH